MARLLGVQAISVVVLSLVHRASSRAVSGGRTHTKKANVSSRNSLHPTTANNECPAPCNNAPLRCLDGTKPELKQGGSCCEWHCLSGAKVCYEWVQAPTQACADGTAPQRTKCDRFTCQGEPVDTGPAIAAGRVYVPALDASVRSIEVAASRKNCAFDEPVASSLFKFGRLSERLLAAVLEELGLDDELMQANSTLQFDLGNHQLAQTESLSALIAGERRFDVGEVNGNWSEQARDEHASVAAFALVQLDLLAHGAPRALIDRTLIASQEELAHVCACELLAGSHDQFVLPEHDLHVRLGKDWARLMHRSIFEGAVPEGNAAIRLWRHAHAAFTSGKNATAQLLWAMGHDEARHAELAHDIALWAAQSHGLKAPSISIFLGHVGVEQHNSTDV